MQLKLSLLIAFAVSFTASSPLCLAQPLREAPPLSGILTDVGGGGGNSGSGGRAPSYNPPSRSGPVNGQVREYRALRGGSTYSFSSGKPKDIKKLTKDADRFYNEGLVAEKKGDLNGAVIKLKQSLSIREYVWGARDRSIPSVMQKMAEIYAKQNKPALAVATLERSLAYCTRIFGPGTPERIPVLLLIGAQLEKKKEHEKSFEHYKQAYVLLERKIGKESPETIKLRLKLARMAKDNGWYQYAADYYKETVELDSTKLSPADLSASLEEYSAVLSKLGREDEAKEMLAKAHPDGEK